MKDTAQKSRIIHPARALCSVSDMRGVPSFISALLNSAPSLKIYCTAGTYTRMRSEINTHHAARLFNLYDYLPPEHGTIDIVKTLNPRLYIGILADLDNPQHRTVITNTDIMTFDIVIANFYRERIDIGGPAMIRAAAKNAQRVVALTHRNQFAHLMHELRRHNGCTTYSHRLWQAQKAMRHVVRYIRASSKHLTPIPDTQSA